MDRSKIGRRLLVSVTAALGWLTVCSAEAQESESQFTLQCKAEVTEGTATTPWEGTCIKVAYQGAPANKF